MKKGLTTIYDIAKALEISASTVSRALRNHPDISSTMVEKIKATARQLNYKPNTIAQSLKERKTKTIGVVLPELTNYFYMAVLNGIEELSFRKGYHVLLAKSTDSYQREVQMIDSLSSQVDGIIACLSQETRKVDHFKKMNEHNIPLVLFERVSDRVPASKVTLDYTDIAYSLTEHLIKSGYRRICLITGASHISSCRHILNGYKTALDRYQLVFDKELVFTTGLTLMDGQIAFQKAIQLSPKPDAFLVATDALALSVHSEAAKTNHLLGTEIGLACCGSDPVLSLTEPSITGVQPKGFEVGSMSAQFCINEIEKEKNQVYKTRKEHIHCEIVIRKSSLKTGQGLVVSSYSKYLNQKDEENPLIYIY